MPGPRDVALLEAELHPRRNADLLLHEVDARHGLRDRMLHLQPSVHLEEEELPLTEHELDSPGVHVAGRRDRADRRGAHRRARLRGQGGRWRLLHDLLMPALDRALALAQVDGVAVLVADDLDLDVPRPANVALEVDSRVAERRSRSLVAALHRGHELVLRLDDLHADAAAAT